VERETWVGIAWAVGLFAAMAGVFAYEAFTFELEEFHVAFEEESTSGQLAGPTLAVGATEQHKVPVESATNLTRVVFTVEWTDSVEPADRFTVVVVGPGVNMTKQAADSNGRIVIEFLGVAPPEQDHIEGVDLAHAKDTDLPRAVVAQGFAGNWTVTVTLANAEPTASPGVGGLPDPMSCGQPNQPDCDGSNGYTLKWAIFSYKAHFPSDDEAHA